MDNLRDLLERAAWTFTQAFLAAFVCGDLGTLRVAGIAGLAATLSVIKTYAKDRIS